MGDEICVLLILHLVLGRRGTMWRLEHVMIPGSAHLIPG
jgi:hypothetical protein